MKSNLTYCIIHCRVSTGRQAAQGESLEQQEQICRGIAERNGWVLAHEPWLEAHTGSAEVRPDFEDILKFLDKNRDLVGYYLFRTIDRFTRGGVDLYIPMKNALRDRGVEMIDSAGVIQPRRNTLEHLGFTYPWSMDDPSEVSQLMMATTAKSEKMTILTRMIGGEIALAQKGYRVRQPADGYINERVFIDGKWRTIQRPDPERATFFTTMFEARAARQLTDRQIVDRINAMGYRSRSIRRWNAKKTEVIGSGGERPLSTARLRSIIRNPIYCGVVWESWTHWKPLLAPYPGLVSIDTYNAANRGDRYILKTANSLELLHNYDPEKPRRLLNLDNPEYPYKHVVMCPVCRKPFRGSASRGRGGQRFPAYHCDRKHKRIGIKKGVFDATVVNFIEQLHLAPEYAPYVQDVAAALYEKRTNKLAAVSAEMREASAGLELKKAEAVKAFVEATSPVVRAALEQKVEEIEAQIIASKTQATAVTLNRRDIDDYLSAVRNVLEHPEILLENAESTLSQRETYSLVFTALPTISELGDGTAKLSPFFRLCGRSEGANFALAGPHGLTWNQIEDDIVRWKTARHGFRPNLSSRKCMRIRRTTGYGPQPASSENAPRRSTDPARTLQPPRGDNDDWHQAA